MTIERADAVVVGGGIAGALAAQVLVRAGMKVVLLEAGSSSDGLSADGWDAYVRRFHESGAKVPNAPYPDNPNAPSPSVLHVGGPSDAGYFHQRGPNPFRSDYNRALGGTTLHWLGTTLRFTPACFEMRRRYGRGVDWPIRYADLAPWYERAEWEIGVSGDTAEQSFHGISFGEGYDYPMRPIPNSWADRWLAGRLGDASFDVGGTRVPLTVTNTPVGRNSLPRTGGALVAGERREAWLPGGGSPELAWRGERCEGNSSCIPICPVQAKYSALRTLRRTLGDAPGRFEIRTQCVASRLEIDPDDGRVSAVVYKRYDRPGAAGVEERRIAGRIVVLAASAVENAKLGLASRLRDASGQLGRNLMDHPFLLAWGLAPEPVGAYRGPSSTAGLEMFRDGPFRRDRAGFRAEIGNWGWDLAAGGPYQDVFELARGPNPRGVDIRRRLAETVPRQIRLGAVIEQEPLAENRVSIRPDLRDAIGEPRPIIDYRIDDYAFEGLRLARAVFAAVFEKAGIEDRTRYDRANPGYVERDGEAFVYYGSGHLVGTHRMGATAAEGVTDPFCRAHGHPNLWMVGAGAMPTTGTCNPTLTLAALTLRAAGEMTARAGGLG